LSVAAAFEFNVTMGAIIIEDYHDTDVNLREGPLAADDDDFYSRECMRQVSATCHT
jgi:hypothetical protein